MTLRQTMGDETHRIHELVEELLDREDSLIVLIDGRGAITYGTGFGLSPCQQELVSTDIERSVRALSTRRAANRKGRGESEELKDSGGRTRIRGTFRSDGVRVRSGLVDRSTPSVESGDPAFDRRGSTVGPVLRVARKAAASGLG
jgi:hypothetical protein